MAAVPTLTAPQLALVESLASGPHSTVGLVTASGKGRDYVRQNIRRLIRRGCDIRRLGPQQSRRGAVYVAVSIPWMREAVCAPRCLRCGSIIARDNTDEQGRPSALCSPCQLSTFGEAS